MKKLIKIQEKANKIYNSNLSWEAKYDLIFSKKISTKVFKKISLQYYDPDTSYEEDVTAFINAFNQYMNERTEKV